MGGNLKTTVAQGEWRGRTWRGVQGIDSRILNKAPHIRRLSQYEHGKPKKWEKGTGILRPWANDKRMIQV